MDEARDVPRCEEGIASPELPTDCYESAQTPADLFRKLGEWGVESMVIPHGNTWGFYSPPGTSWDKQLVGANYDPTQQFIVEIMSGHGNSEEFRSWRELSFDAEGKPSCPEPTRDYLPSCWRAGQLIEARCHEAGESAEECALRAEDARLLYAQAGVAGALVVEGEDFEEWLDAGQCKDCFRPSFNYRPRGSTQYALALTNFDDPARPRRFEFGVIASSDNHRARPGTGYKEVDRKLTTEANGLRDETWSERVYPQEDPAPRAVAVDQMDLTRGFGTLEAERQASFFMTGGLAAVHADGRGRDAIWDALRRKEIYGTSGARILLWFQLLNAERPDGSYAAIPMGGKARLVEGSLAEPVWRDSAHARGPADSPRSYPARDRAWWRRPPPRHDPAARARPRDDYRSRPTSGLSALRRTPAHSRPRRCPEVPAPRPARRCEPRTSAPSVHWDLRRSDRRPR
jgi:hypothetical protein